MRMSDRQYKALSWFTRRGAALKELAEPGAPHPCEIVALERMGLIELTENGWVVVGIGDEAKSE